MKEEREGGRKSRAGEKGGGGGKMRSKMPVNTKARRALERGGVILGVYVCPSVCSQSGGRERRLTGSGMETRSQARLSLSWKEASCYASDGAAGHGRCDAFRGSASPG